MRISTRTLSDTIDLTSVGDQKIQIPRDRYIRQIIIDYEANIDTGASATKTGIETLMSNLDLVVAGNDHVKDITPINCRYMNQLDFGTKPRTTPITNSMSGVDVNGTIILDFATAHRNPFDISALLPAHLLSSLNLYGTVVAATAAFGTGGVVNSGKAYVHLKEVHMSKAEERAAYGSKLEKLLKYYESEITLACTAKSNYEWIEDLTVGSILKKLGIITDKINYYRIKQASPIELIIAEAKWSASLAEDKIMYGVEDLPTNLTVYDAEYKSGGLDLRGLKQGDVQLQATTSGSGNITLYYQRLI